MDDTSGILWSSHVLQSRNHTVQWSSHQRFSYDTIWETSLCCSKVTEPSHLRKIGLLLGTGKGWLKPCVLFIHICLLHLHFRRII